MPFAGTYVIESNDNYDAWLKAVGIPAEVAEKMCAAKPKLEVTEDATSMTVKTTAGEKVFTNTAVFGQDSKTSIAGLEYVLNLTKSDKGLTGTVTLGDKKGTVTVESTETSFTQTMVVDGVTCKRVYKRQ